MTLRFTAFCFLPTAFSSFTTPPGNRTQSDGLKVRYADHHTGEVLRDLKMQISNLRFQKSEMPHQGIEPRLTASNTVVRPSHSQGQNGNPKF